MEFNSLVEREDLGYSKYKSIQYVKKRVGRVKSASWKGVVI